MTREIRIEYRKSTDKMEFDWVDIKWFGLDREQSSRERRGRKEGSRGWIMRSSVGQLRSLLFIW